MCGIAGIMMKHGVTPDRAVLSVMGQALQHRGPDGQGDYFKENVALLQTRLAIIDLVTGDQPLYDKQGDALVANGEIYNYVELRTAMPDVAFATKSDCETPLHLYRRYGMDFSQHLRGMYAIALHDPSSGQLILARDPFGIKPIYYAETAQGFLFASEIEPILATGLVGQEINEQARQQVLQLHYSCGAQSIFENVRRVLPGETLIVQDGKIIQRSRLAALTIGKPSKSNDDAVIKKFDRVLEDCITVHQRSDVPYGMFLSGGIDSSAVLAMMARCNTQPVQAFTAGFSGTNVADERAHARKVAKAFNAAHHEIEFSEKDFWNLLPEIAVAFDDPTTDYATLPTYKLAMAARQAGLKVILSGEGGDELFAGYGRYRRAMRPWWLGGRMPGLKGSLNGLGLLRHENISTRIPAVNFSGATRLQKIQAMDVANWLPNDLLLKLDRCLMRQAVEGRTPFLDPVMSAFAFNLPDGQKIRNGQGKWVLRQWLAQHAPISEPFAKKRGFTVPVNEWIGRRGREIGDVLCHQESIKEICHPDQIAAVCRSAGDDKKAGFAAWTLLFYALWHHVHVARQSMSGDVFTVLKP